MLGKLRNKGEASHACMLGFFLLVQHTQTAHKFLMLEMQMLTSFCSSSAVGASAFVKDHGSELQTNFLSSPVPVAELPAHEHTLLEKGSQHVEHIRAELSPIMRESVLKIEALVDGRVYITVKDWAAFKLTGGDRGVARGA